MIFTSHVILLNLPLKSPHKITYSKRIKWTSSTGLKEVSWNILKEINMLCRSESPLIVALSSSVLKAGLLVSLGASTRRVDITGCLLQPAFSDVNFIWFTRTLCCHIPRDSEGSKARWVAATEREMGLC